MKDDETLKTLIGVARRHPTPRALCCPSCRREVVLKGGMLVCTAEVPDDRHRYPTLAELEVVADPKVPW